MNIIRDSGADLDWFQSKARKNASTTHRFVKKMINLFNSLNILKSNNKVAREVSRQTIAETKSKLEEALWYLKGLIVKVKSKEKTIQHFVIAITSMTNFVGHIFSVVFYFA